MLDCLLYIHIFKPMEGYMMYVCIIGLVDTPPLIFPLSLSPSLALSSPSISPVLIKVICRRCRLHIMMVQV